MVNEVIVISNEALMCSNKCSCRVCLQITGLSNSFYLCFLLTCIHWFSLYVKSQKKLVLFLLLFFFTLAASQHF